MTSKTPRYLATLTASLFAAMLTACGGGGGGGGGSSGSTPTPDPTLVRENYALVQVSPQATYAVASAEALYYNTLNSTRLGIGAGALTQSAALDAAARAHLAYLVTNYPDIGSSETTGKTGFTGATPTDRATRAGYASAKVSEFIGSTVGVKATVAECLTNLLNNPYALNALAEPWRDIGIAYGTLKAAPPAPAASAASGVNSTDTTLPAVACVMVVGVKAGINGQLPDANYLKSYPYAEQQEVPTDFGPGPQGQQPAPDLQNKSGYPLQVSMANFGALSSTNFSVERFVLRDVMGREVAARLIVNPATTVSRDLVFYRDPAGLLPASDAMLLPLSPLAADTRYTAEFIGANGSQRFTKTWSFTTRVGALPTP